LEICFWRFWLAALDSNKLFESSFPLSHFWPSLTKSTLGMSAFLESVINVFAQVEGLTG